MADIGKDLPTEELLARAAEGDSFAINQLLERHRARLATIIRPRIAKVLSRRVDASDIVQEVLICASRRLSEYLSAPSIPFHLWVRQLAMDRLADMHRRHNLAGRRSVSREQFTKRNGHSSSIDLLAQLRDPEVTPAAAAIRREIEERFWVAVDQLEEEDREVILMRHFEHLTNREVAETLGITPPAAGMRYLRALRRLRERLESDKEGGLEP
ncbi:MAG: sigma-70 family RNA polymerase sigma factor [Planctomycetota bacterium]